MPPIFEPTLETLDAMEREFSKRLAHRLHAVLRGSTKQLFDEGVSDSLLELGGRIVNLSNTLKAEQTAIGLVAKHYLMAYLSEKHGGDPTESNVKPTQLAKTWLAKLEHADA
jgi:hypothetical protein